MNPARVDEAYLAYIAAIAECVDDGYEVTSEIRRAAMQLALEASDRVMEKDRDGFSIVLAPDLPPHVIRLVGQRDIVEISLLEGAVIKVEKRLPSTLADLTAEPLPSVESSVYRVRAADCG